MPDWLTLPGLAPYAQTLAAMETRAEAIAMGTAPEAVWLLEHPPLYTAGTSAGDADLTDPTRFPVHKVGRGGQYTYHGPGQRVIYVMLDVGARGRDVRCFVRALENWVIAALAEFNVTGQIRPGRVGVWVARDGGQGHTGARFAGPQHPDVAVGKDGIGRTTAKGVATGPQNREYKIAAIGVKLRRWISFHGISINVDPDLEHFSGIVPCGIREHGVTSLVDLGLPVTMADLDVALQTTFTRFFPDGGMHPDGVAAPQCSPVSR